MHEEFEKGRIEYRLLQHSLGEAFLCRECAVVDCVSVSTCKKGRQSFLVAFVNSGSVYIMYE